MNKVHRDFATLGDALEHAKIAMAEAVELAESAEADIKLAEEALRRAGGDGSKLLIDLCD